ncbi:MAG: hypothetical protein AB7J46_06515 [Candidatus Altimarinota bacterium]
MEQKPKITIGLPSYGLMTTECVMALSKMLMTSKLDLHLVFNVGLYIDYNRNQIVDAALQNGSDYLLFVDSDMAFPVDGLERLLAHQKDIVGGYYNTRRGNCPVRVWDEDGKLIAPDPIPEELFQCAVLPTGFMLIRLEALKKLQKPFFQVITHAQGTIGEDVSFCKKAVDAGLEIWCDGSIRVGHVGKMIF